MPKSKAIVDRTANRAWKRRRNYIIIMRLLIRMNRPEGGILKAVLATRADINHVLAAKKVNALFEMRPDEELPNARAIPDTGRQDDRDLPAQGETPASHRVPRQGQHPVCETILRP